MDQFGWTESEAILYLGIAMSSGGILTVFCFASVGPLSKRFDERKILIFAGIIPMILARTIMLPIPGLPHAELANKTKNNSDTFMMGRIIDPDLIDTSFYDGKGSKVQRIYPRNFAAYTGLFPQVLFTTTSPSVPLTADGPNTLTSSPRCTAPTFLTPSSRFPAPPMKRVLLSADMIGATTSRP